MIEVQDLTFRIQQKTLVDRLSLRIHPGRLLVVVGPNGAGKSTLLKLLTRDVAPSSGSILFDSKPLGEYKHGELARKRAVLTQQNQLSLPFLVSDVVMMGRYPFHKNAPTEKDYDIVRQCLEKVEMTELAGRLYPTLSGGEQQRVQLARALAQVWQTEGGYLFLDEPTNGMDLKHQYHSLTIARELARDGYGVVAVLHDLNMALHYADEIALLHKGRMIAAGNPPDVLTVEHIEGVFGVTASVFHSPEINRLLIIPLPEESRKPYRSTSFSPYSPL